MEDDFSTRIDQWFDGELDDDELTDNEIAELEERVNAAVVARVLCRPGVHTFPDHPTLQ